MDHHRVCLWAYVSSCLCVQNVQQANKQKCHRNSATVCALSTSPILIFKMQMQKPVDSNANALANCFLFHPFCQFNVNVLSEFHLRSSALPSGTFPTTYPGRGNAGHILSMLNWQCQSVVAHSSFEPRLVSCHETMVAEALECVPFGTQSLVMKSLCCIQFLCIFMLLHVLFLFIRRWLPSTLPRAKRALNISKVFPAPLFKGSVAAIAPC